MDLRLTLYTARDFPSGAELLERAEPYPPIDWSNPDAVLSALRQDMKRVNAVLSKIEEAIISQGKPQPEVINTLESEVEDLTARQARYLK